MSIGQNYIGPPLRLVGYLRVSTDKQAEFGQGLRVQENAIRLFARNNGHKLVGLHSDEGVSGSNDIPDRVGLPAALTMLQEGKADGLIAYNLDRLARQLTVQEGILAKCWSMGSVVFTCDGGLVDENDAEDPFKAALRQIRGVFAELDRAMIVKRMRNGKRTKADAGGYIGGRPSYGFKASGGDLVADQGEQQTLQRISQLHNDGRSLREIADTLTAEGRQPKSGKWHPGTISKLVKRAQTTATS